MRQLMILCYRFSRTETVNDTFLYLKHRYADEVVSSKMFIDQNVPKINFILMEFSCLIN